MTAVNECGNDDDAHECPPAKQHAPRNARAAGIGTREATTGKAGTRIVASEAASRHTAPSPITVESP